VVSEFQPPEPPRQVSWSDVPTPPGELPTQEKIVTESRKGPHREDPAERALVLTRAFETPRQRIFKAWIDPKHAAQC